MRVLRDGTLLACRTSEPAGIEPFDAPALLAPPELPPAEALALAELEAAATVQNGDIDPLPAH